MQVGGPMIIKDFLDKLAQELQSKAGITVEIVDDHNFPGGFYMNFSEFSTAVLRVNQYGKFSMRGVEFKDDVFSYPWKYKFLMLTDTAVDKLAKTFPQVEFDVTKEAEKAMFPLFCYINVLHQFYRKKLGSKKRWYPQFKDIETRKFEKIRRTMSNLPSREALKLIPKEEQETYIEA